MSKLQSMWTRKYGFWFLLFIVIPRERCRSAVECLLVLGGSSDCSVMMDPFHFITGVKEVVFFLYFEKGDKRSLAAN